MEAITTDIITGWTWDEKNAETSQIVSLYEKEVWLGDTTANLDRADLLKAGIGRGNHCFRFATPGALKDGQPHSIRAVVKNSGFELSGSPKVWQSK